MQKKIVLFAMLVIIIVSIVPTQSRQRCAPSFALFSAKGKLVTLKKLVKTEPVLISFFASYCIPCRREIPELISLEKKYPNRFRLVLVNIDREGKGKALSYLNSINVERDCLLDKYQMTAEKYMSTPRVPACFLINKQGQIIFESIGDKKESIRKLERIIRSL